MHASVLAQQVGRIGIGHLLVAEHVFVEGAERVDRAQADVEFNVETLGVAGAAITNVSETPCADAA